MLNIVIPMAGLGSRFSKAGYVDPKPLIAIHGTPMIQLVIKNLTPQISHRFIFVGQREQISRYGLAEKLATWAPGMQLIELNHVTEGAACTVLMAEALINDGMPLMIANCDQYVDINIDDYLRTMDTQNLDGLIMTMQADDPKWSFVGLDSQGYVSCVVEKEVISNQATVGIYNYRNGSDFVMMAKAMIANNERVNGEFYVAPVYNQMILKKRRIGVYSVGSLNQGMYGLGTPDDLNYFLSQPISKKLVKNHENH